MVLNLPVTSAVLTNGAQRYIGFSPSLTVYTGAGIEKRVCASGTDLMLYDQFDRARYGLFSSRYGHQLVRTARRYRTLKSRSGYLTAPK
jgi:hypothetical protein